MPCYINITDVDENISNYEMGESLIDKYKSESKFCGSNVNKK